VVKRQTEQRAKQEKDQAELKALQEKQQAELETAVKERRETLRELRATREIILAGQPLVSLKLIWTFKNVPGEILEIARRKDIESDDKESEDRLEYYVGRYEPSTYLIAEAMAQDRRYQVVYPSLNVLAGGKWELSPVLAILTLNSSGASVLPLGCLNHNESLVNAPGGVEFMEDIDNSRSNQSLERTRRSEEFTARRTDTKDGLALEWHFPAGEFDKVVDHRVSGLQLTATFPETIRMVILNSIESLPLNSNNFAQMDEPFPESGDRNPGLASFIDKSVLRLIPNDLPNYVVQYKMSYKGHSHLTGQEMQQSDGAFFAKTKDFCNVSIWTGNRVSSD